MEFIRESSESQRHLAIAKGMRKMHLEDYDMWESSAYITNVMTQEEETGEKAATGALKDAAYYYEEQLKLKPEFPHDTKDFVPRSKMLPYVGTLRAKYQSVAPPTTGQVKMIKEFLKYNGAVPKSMKEASVLIDSLKNKRNRASQKQMALLRTLRVRVTQTMNKRQASLLIKRALRNRDLIDLTKA